MEIKTIFLIFGVAAAVYAVGISFVGLRARNFPPGRAMLGGLIAIGAILVIGTAVYAVKLSTLEQHEREEGKHKIPGDESTEAASNGPVRIPARLA